MSRHTIPFFWLSYLFFCLNGAGVLSVASPTIEVWYGNNQSFGHNGSPQRWVNVLGRVTGPAPIVFLRYSLNGEAELPLSIGHDFKRLAKVGDFNVEIDRDQLQVGNNRLELLAKDSQGGEARQTVTLRWHKDRKCLLPYQIDWSKLDTIQEAAQVIDGRWTLTPEGIRIAEPYYAGALTIGDSTWRNFEISARVKFHGVRRPSKRDGGRKFIHADLAARWPGHGMDKKQPHLKWHPVGAMCEFMLQTHPEPCRWRMLGGPGIKETAAIAHDITWDKWYVMKLCATTPQPSTSRYQAKLWEADQSEPPA